MPADNFGTERPVIIVTLLGPPGSLLLCGKLEFVVLLDRRNQLSNYHVIANQSADWCGNPVDFRTVLGENPQI